MPDTNEHIESVNPYDGSVVGEVAADTPASVGKALDAARGAARDWVRVPLSERAVVLRRYAELLREKAEPLAVLITAETGKPLWESRTEAAAMAGKIEISIEGHARRTGDFELNGARTRFHPLGVVGVLGPFNFPGHLPNGHIVPALLAGNAVVFKPSDQTPLTGARIGQWLVKAGLPEGVLQVVQGGAEVGRVLATPGRLDGLCFTGSSRVGLDLHRRFGGHPQTLLALEMGGNNPMVVDEVEDVEAGARLVCQSAFITAGQRCTCARRLLVPRGPWGDRFLAAVSASMDRIRVGDPSGEPQPFVGTLIGAGAAERVLASEARWIEAGAESLRRLERGPESSAQLRPGLIDVTACEDLEEEECFGPLLQVIRYEDMSAAIEICNDTAYGLAAGLLSEAPSVYERFRSEVKAGLINWNTPLTGASSSAPFGGQGLSGNHRPSALFAADYTAFPVASLEREAPAGATDLPGFPRDVAPGGKGA